MRIEVDRVLLERATRRGLGLGLGIAFWFGTGAGGLSFADAVRDEVDHVEASHPALMEEVDGVRVFLAEDGDQHIGAGDLFLAR